jgi:hypothetical protein
MNHGVALSGIDIVKFFDSKWELSDDEFCLGSALRRYRKLAASRKRNWAN